MKESVKITMVSNYINHHQMPFCEALNELSECEFTFVQTMQMEQKRIDMGWYINPASVPYVVESYLDADKAGDKIMSADILLIGWLEDESVVQDALRECRKNHNRLIIRISERLYREGQWKMISPKGHIRKYRDHIRYRKAPVYLLCNGAYVASDYNLIGAYRGKMYRFGYFPRTRYYYNEADLWNNKAKLERVHIDHSEELPGIVPTVTSEEIKIVWAGRFLPLKHPEYMVKLATDLVKAGYRFHIDMIGSGPMADELKAEAVNNMIEDYITFRGFLPPDKVRFIMERSHIHIFTSNHLEGWGAVINEAMNGGCAEVVSAEAGASLFLIDHERNGLIYEDDSYDKMLTQVKRLFETPELITEFGKRAYQSVANLWNAEVAASRLMEFYAGYKAGNIVPPEEGPFSVAPVINPGFFKSGKLGE